MKTMKSLLIVAAFAAFTGNLFAQNSGAALPALPVIPTALTATTGEIATENSVMYYLVTPDTVLSVSPLYDPSVFKWATTKGSIINTTASVSPAGYVLDSVIQIDYDGVAPGVFTNVISAIERSVPTFDPTAGCEDLTPELRDVTVVARPTSPTSPASLNMGACGSPGTFTIPYGLPAEVAGNYPLYVEFTISAFNVSNVAIGTPVTRVYTLATPASAFALLDADLDLADGVDANATPDGVKYTIDLTRVWDQYSVRASNRTDADVATAATASDVNIFILPRPATGAINHVAP
jgi:hypothetical protein